MILWGKNNFWKSKIRDNFGTDPLLLLVLWFLHLLQYFSQFSAHCDDWMSNSLSVSQLDSHITFFYPITHIIANSLDTLIATSLIAWQRIFYALQWTFQSRLYKKKVDLILFLFLEFKWKWGTFFWVSLWNLLWKNSSLIRAWRLLQKENGFF